MSNITRHTNVHGHSYIVSNLNYHHFPDNGSIIEQIHFVLEYAVRAPSTHNSQPWNFKITDNVISLFADHTRKLPEGDKDGRDLYISLGACLEHLTTALAYFQMLGEVKRVEGEDPASAITLISVHSSQGRNVALLPYVKAIEERFNARGPFHAKAIPNEVLVQLEALKEEGVSLHVSTKKDDIQKLATLTALGMREVHTHQPFRTELSRWMINNYSTRKDGIPGYSMLAPGLLSLILPWLVGTFNMGAILAKLNTKAIISASGVALINGERDTSYDWVSTGMLFARASLLLNTYGIRPSIYVASVEIPQLRKELSAHFLVSGYPQFTFALGYPKVILRQSPRLAPKSRIIV